MKADVWNWKDHKTSPSPIWEKVRILSHDFGEPVISFLEIPGAFIPGVGEGLGKLKALFGADLRISSINNAFSLKPADGAPGPLTSKSGHSPVFLQGCDISFTIAHNGRGKETISLEYIDICLINFTPGEDDFYAYQLSGEEIIGAGLVEPMRFFAELDASGANTPRRSVRSNAGKPELLAAKSANFFNTEPEVYYTFTTSEPPLIIKIKVLALDQGFYEFCFRFFYRIAAKELRQYTSSKILLYSGG